MSKNNCHQCRHYFITWDGKNPYGCRLFQIKTSTLPSIVVKSAGSGECQGFSLKNQTPQGSKESRAS